MPRLTKAVPKYQKHKASGLAVVRIDGKDFYLGPFGTKASHIEYDRLISHWIANGRRLPTDRSTDTTIVELIAAYWKFAKQHYRKNGEPTNELDNIRYALRPLKKLYGHTPVWDFGPLALKSVRNAMIDSGVSRGVINSRIGNVKRLFRWAVSEELAPPSLCHTLDAVTGLQKGRTVAREATPIGPVPASIVNATLPYLPKVVADMVRFQRLVGCRPSEVCELRPCDLDRSEDVWKYSYQSHKTEHFGRQRVVFIGPRAQQILLPYLLRDAEAYCFSPAESERERKAELRATRKTKVQPSQRDRRKKNPKRKPKGHYSRTSYLWAIRRACEKVFPAPKELEGDDLKAWRKQNWWTPNQLRYTVGTDIRKKFGLEAAQVVLGHSKADVTQIYAERDLQMAAEIMRKVG